MLFYHLCIFINSPPSQQTVTKFHRITHVNDKSGEKHWRQNRTFPFSPVWSHCTCESPGTAEPRQRSRWVSVVSEKSWTDSSQQSPAAHQNPVISILLTTRRISRWPHEWNSHATGPLWLGNSIDRLHLNKHHKSQQGCPNSCMWVFYISRSLWRWEWSEGQCFGWWQYSHSWPPANSGDSKRRCTVSFVQFVYLVFFSLSF